MATSDGQLTSAVKSISRDARRTAGLVALVSISLLITIALATTVMTGWQGNWASGLNIIKSVSLFTLWQALLSTVLSLAFAIPVALALDNHPRFFGRRFILLLFTIPLALPVIIAVMALLSLLGRNGLLSQFLTMLGLNWRPDIYGLTGILIAHVFFNMPLAVRIITQRFQAIPAEQWKLAESLQFTAWHRFRHILAPVLRAVLPGLASLIFLLCLSSYTIILVLGGGPQTTTIQVAIYQALSFDLDLARAATLTLVQLGLTMTLLWLLPSMPQMRLQSQTKSPRRYHQLSALNSIASYTLLTVGSASIALPLAAVALSGLAANHAKLLSDPLLWQALTVSIVIGVCSSLLTITASWALSAAIYSYQRTQSATAAKWLQAIPFGLLAIPSIILGVGWFLFVLKIGLPLTIAPLLVVFANTLMALPFAMQIIEPALHANYKANDRLAQTLGINGLSRFQIVDLPVMRRALLSAGLFAFALSLGDLGVVTLFGTDQLLTFPALIYQKMGSYRSTDAAGLALYLAVLTGVLTYLALRAETQESRIQ
jgi:thiamine transport system permease protein